MMEETSSTEVQPIASKSDFVFCIHGGAGVISKSLDGKPYLNALESILANAYHYALTASSAVDIAEYSVTCLESEALFNAGHGAVFTADGLHELEASIMDGATLRCGAVSMITTVKHPISAARCVMEHTKHIHLAGHAAEAVAAAHDLEVVDNSYFSTPTRKEQLNRAKAAEVVIRDHDAELTDHGTVGCVVYFRGQLASATSTGGMTNKMSGRMGDTPIIGAGTYANNATCAISATGTGEEFMKHVASYDVSCRMEMKGLRLDEAIEETLTERLPPDSGGMIGVDKYGNHYMGFNCSGMFRGYCSSNGKASVGIWEDEREVHL